jgi:sugar porter (SP) family MFS transporter
MLVAAAILFAISAIFAALPEKLRVPGAALGSVADAIRPLVPQSLSWLEPPKLDDALWGFVIARVLGGVGIGIASMLSPLYIAEAAPADRRGRLVTLNQMAIITGILVSYVASYFLADLGPNNWRWMFAVAGAPALFFWCALLFVPESPRWLIKQQRADEASRVLRDIGGSAHAEREREEIEAALAEEGVSLRQLLAPGLRIALAIGILLAIFQQITGINTILYYAPTIFLKAGFGKAEDAILASALVGVVNFIFTAVALATIDRLGRKPLLLIGSGGMAVSLGLLGFVLRGADEAGQTGGSTTLMVACILAYVAFFAIGLGPVVWLLMSEIFPTRIRGRAMSLATISLWAACLVVTLTFLRIAEKLTMGGAFWLYAGICVVNFAFVAWLVPETKGKTLEQIERSWTHRR